MATTKKTDAAPAKPRARRAKPEEIVSTNPATLEELGRVPVTQPGDLDAIVERAAEAQRRWAQVPLRERARLIERVSAYLLDNHERIAALITRENGKTIVESYLMELLPVMDVLAYTAKNGPALLARERIPTPQIFWKQKRHYFDYEPLGVVGVIPAWNYPFLIPASDVAIAIMAGNAVVLKPSPLTPLIGDAIAHAFHAAGLPDGLLTVAHGDAPIGAALCEHPGIAAIAFTGSVGVGRKVGEACGRHLKHALLELGGKDAAVVCADADLDRAVKGILWAGNANCGQTCAGIERVYVQRPVYEEFLERMASAAERLKPGDPMDPDTQVGPFTDPRQYDLVVSHVDEAIERGAKRHTGGPVDVGMPGKWYAPAVLTDVDHSMTLMRDETFGPVVPLMPYDEDADAVQLANDSEFGLGASVWTRDMDRAKRLAGKIEAGMVWVNDHMYSYAAAQTPWGGVKRSGVGVAHSRYGYHAYTQKRLLSIDSGRVPVAFWHPYDARLRDAFGAALRALYAPSAGEKLRTALRHRDEFKGIIDRVRKG